MITDVDFRKQRFTGEIISTPPDSAEDRSRHGKPWTAEEHTLLMTAFCCGWQVTALGLLMHRKNSAVMARLEWLGLLENSSPNWRQGRVTKKAAGKSAAYARAASKFVDQFEFHPEPPNNLNSQPQPQTEGKSEMTTPVIQEITLIRGVDAKQMSDAEIFKLIMKLEGEVKDLSSIKASSKKIQKAIEAIEADITKLVEYVDSRE